jgi:hypothetical protein
MMTAPSAEKSEACEQPGIDEGLDLAIPASLPSELDR